MGIKMSFQTGALIIDLASGESGEVLDVLDASEAATYGRSLRVWLRESDTRVYRNADELEIY